MRGHFVFIGLVAAAISVSGCSGKMFSERNKLNDSPLAKFGEKKELDDAKKNNDADSAHQAGQESIFNLGSDGSILGGGGKKSKERIRGDKLFAGTLDVVLGLPIAVASREGGLVATDWKIDPKDPNSRYRVNVRVSGDEPYGDVKVVVLKQSLEHATWVDQPADQTTARHIAKKIRKLAEIARP